MVHPCGNLDQHHTGDLANMALTKTEVTNLKTYNLMMVDEARDRLVAITTMVETMTSRLNLIERNVKQGVNVDDVTISLLKINASTITIDSKTFTDALKKIEKIQE